MGQAAGIVEVISAKPTRNGGNAYNVKLSDGNWYGYGFDKPSFNEGADVEFTFAENGNFKNVDASTVVVKAAAAAKAAASKGASSAPAATSSYDDRQLAISYQAARKDALQIVEIALAHDAVSLGAKKADKLGVLESIVDKMTNQFFEDTKVLGKATVDVTGTVAVDDDE